MEPQTFTGVLVLGLIIGVRLWVAIDKSRYEAEQGRLKALDISGVDIVASKNGSRCAIQCKRQARNVSRRAISDVVIGKLH